MAWAIRRFFLRCGGDMGVGVEGEPCGVVSEHTGHCLNVYAVFCYGGKVHIRVIQSTQ